MAIPEEIQRQVLAEATSATPNYDIDYNDPAFSKVTEAESQANAQLDNMYGAYNEKTGTYEGGMIGSTDKYYKDLENALTQQADQMKQAQQEQTDFTIEKIEQQKDQANKDYLKEQSGAYVDWQKQSNQYGTEAEKMASAGLSGTGFSESSQVSMYNTYQNRVATAREVLSKAILNYDNNIKEAMLQNSAALAEISLNLLVKQAELALEGMQYKNQLITERANQQFQYKQFYANEWQRVLDQLNTQNALKEDIRQYTETQKWNTEQAEINRQFDAQENELNRKHAVAIEDLKHKYALEKLKAETEEEKKLIAERHKNDIAKLNQQLANEKALLKYQQELKASSSPVTGYSGSSASKGSSAVGKGSSSAKKFFASTSIKTYSDATSFLKSKGIPGSAISGIMTQNEWTRRRSSYLTTGQGYSGVKNYSSYAAYLQDYVAYCVKSYGEANIRKQNADRT